MRVERVGTSALNRELCAYPAWLADTYRTWIRQEESAGNGFTSARAAVRHAIDASRGVKA